MKIRVRLFARYRELAGTGEIYLEIQPDTTVSDFKKNLANYLPVLRDNTTGLAVAVNLEFTEGNQKLKQGDEVALLAPLGGG